MSLPMLLQPVPRSLSLSPSSLAEGAHPLLCDQGTRCEGGRWLLNSPARPPTAQELIPKCSHPARDYARDPRSPQL